MNKFFADKLSFDVTHKTAVSVRDGVQEYLGAELGMLPADKVFKIYRSPATIANAANKMAGIPLTNDHVALDKEPAFPVGKVVSASMIDLMDEGLKSTLAVKNLIDVDQVMLSQLQSGKRELSLGYTAKLSAHDIYDFEQTDITPHHLAVVDRGRCGGACSFIDKGVDLKNRFMDAEGNLNLEEIVTIISDLPEAMKKLNMEQLAKVMPMIQEIATIARAANMPIDQAEEATKEVELEDKPTEKVKTDKTETTDKPEDGKKYTDAAFSDALKTAIDQHTAVIVKARDFVDCGYAYAGKSTAQIMRDAVEAEHGKAAITDEELGVAFKLLKKSAATDLKNFGDSNKNSFLTLANREI
jgi:hypothetical protein